MHLILLVLVGLLVGFTTVLFGFGGGFVAVPVITWTDHAMGLDSLHVATSTSLVVMAGNALVATMATPRSRLSWLGPRRWLLVSLAAGGVLGSWIGMHVRATFIRWGFVAYLVVTLLDILLRHGFFAHPEQRRAEADRGQFRALTAPIGLPMGALAAVLGVGGSVMTVPAMRRAGASMAQATALANPMTLAIVLPGMLLSLGASGAADIQVPGMVGSIDLGSGLALLAGVVPVIILLRRRPPSISDRAHAIGYVILLAIAGFAVAVS